MNTLNSRRLASDRDGKVHPSHASSISNKAGITSRIILEDWFDLQRVPTYLKPV